MGNRGRPRFHIAVLVLLIGLAALCGQTRAQNDARIGTVLAVDGKAEVRAKDTTAWKPLGFRDAIFLADSVRTAAASKIKVLLRDESIMTLGEDSEMTFTEFLLTPQKKRSIVNILFGTLKVLTSRVLGSGSAVEVHTPNAVAGVRGTSFVVRFMPPDTTEIYVFEGTVTAGNLDPAIPEVEGIPPNAWTRVIGNAPPQEAIELTPGERLTIEDAVQLIEQIPEEVTPTDQQDAQRDVRGTDGPTPRPESAIVDVIELTALIDVPQDIEQLIEAGVTEFIKNLATNGFPTDEPYGPDETPQGIAVQGLSELGVTIEIPR